MDSGLERAPCTGILPRLLNQRMMRVQTICWVTGQVLTCLISAKPL